MRAHLSTGSFEDMEHRSRQFLLGWVATCLGIAVSVALFDIVMDPYLVFAMPRISGVNARKPAIDTQERMMKAYDVLRTKPRTLIIGSSRADLGLDAQSPVWPAEVRPVYNLALGAASPYIAYRYLQHVMFRQTPRLVVMGLEFSYFLTVDNEPGLEPEAERRLAVTRNGDRNAEAGRQYMQDFFRATLSLDALTDSVTELTANFRGDSSDMVAGNWEWQNYRRLVSEGGSVPVLTLSDFYNIPAFLNKANNALAMQDLKAIIDLCAAHDARLILFISPSRADELEIIDLEDQWRNFESWKRELVKLVEQYKSSEGWRGVSLWDFSGYNVYSSEAVPEGGRTLQWFWETVHYKRDLGNLVVYRLFGAGTDDFGVALKSSNLDSHLTAIRERQQVYRERYPRDVARVRTVYSMALRLRRITHARLQGEVPTKAE
jgi:hypothetical protein